MIYGYALKEVNGYGLLEMREVTFSAPAHVLREIAAFLSQMADVMDMGGFQKCSHHHIGSTVKNWEQRFPNKDIVVMLPATE